MKSLKFISTILFYVSWRYIEPDENEDTYRIQQQDIAKEADITSATKVNLSCYFLKILLELFVKIVILIYNNIRRGGF